MAEALVIRGRYVGQTFIPDEPLPAAELIIFPDREAPPPQRPVSIFDLFGKAPRLRTAEDIEAQLREEREAWAEP